MLINPNTGTINPLSPRHRSGLLCLNPFFFTFWLTIRVQAWRILLEFFIIVKCLTVGIKNQAIDYRSALLESGMGIFEIPALNRKHPSTSFSVQGRQLKVDVLTPLIGAPVENPIYLNSLKTYATPIRFLDFLLEDVQSAVVIAKSGILVNIPAPARYALHKLVINQRRPPAMQTKARKDILQAEQILSVLIEERPGDILLALEATASQPKKFRQQLRQGIEKLSNNTQKQKLIEMLSEI